jgi:uncharacterized protein (TIGR02246 family)
VFRHRWRSFAIVVLGLAARPATSWASDEEVIAGAKARSQAYVKAFNNHDAKAIGALCTESADFAFLQGDSLKNLQFGLVSGRDQIIATVATFFQMNPSAKVTHTVRRARLIAPDVMLVDEDFEITGLPEESRPIKGKFVIVCVRVDGSWQIAAERNISYDPPRKH